MRNATMVHTNVTMITFFPGLAVGSKFLSMATHTRLDIPAIILTAVETEPKTISTEMIGRSSSGATPLLTRISSGMLSVAKFSSFVTAISPRTAIRQITMVLRAVQEGRWRPAGRPRIRYRSTALCLQAQARPCWRKCWKKYFPTVQKY